jgi:hypothetical protein
MTDRELLELAAKAAKITGWVKDHGGEPCLFRDDFQTPWSPLTDDGDALRLAVLLSFTVQIEHEDEEDPKTYVMDRNGCLAVEDHDDNPCPATRRAIVRAAAEIGRAMP